jgi:hypothetical protein
MAFPDVEFEPFASRLPGTLLQARKIQKSAYSRGFENLEGTFPGISERYSSWLRATRSIRRAALSTVVDASIIKLDGKSQGVATVVKEHPQHSLTGELRNPDVVALNLAYWIDRSPYAIEGASVLSHEETHATIGRLLIARAEDLYPNSYQWAFLASGPNEPSRGLRSHMVSVGATGEYVAATNVQQVDVGEATSQRLYEVPFQKAA